MFHGKTFLAFSRNNGDDPTIEAGVEYDIAEQIDLKNNWFEPGEINPEQIELLIKVASRGLYELFHFCFAGRKLNQKGLQIAMRRFVAVAWLLHSEMLQGAELDADGKPTGALTPLSLEQLGDIPQLDCTKVALSLLAKRFGELFNFHARVQKRMTSKVNYAGAAKIGWAKRRARAKAAAKKR